MIRSLIDEIRLMPEDGTLRIELRGELAGIFALAAESKKPSSLSATGLAEQIKMVAGTRSHLYRTAISWPWRARSHAQTLENNAVLQLAKLDLMD